MRFPPTSRLVFPCATDILYELSVYTNLVRKSLAAHLSIKKTKIVLFLVTFRDILRFGGTPEKISRHISVLRYTG